jgi:hypothetical protein
MRESYSLRNSILVLRMSRRGPQVLPVGLHIGCATFGEAGDGLLTILTNPVKDIFFAEYRKRSREE